MIHTSVSIILRVYYILQSGDLSHFLGSVGGYIRIYLVVYSPETIGGFSLEEKS